MWACGVQWSCIKTKTRKRKGRKPNYTWEAPEPQMEEPTGGMWDYGKG